MKLKISQLSQIVTEEVKKFKTLNESLFDESSIDYKQKIKADPTKSSRNGSYAYDNRYAPHRGNNQVDMKKDIKKQWDPNKIKRREHMEESSQDEEYEKRDRSGPSGIDEEVASILLDTVGVDSHEVKPGEAVLISNGCKIFKDENNRWFIYGYRRDEQDVRGALDTIPKY